MAQATAIKQYFREDGGYFVAPSCQTVLKRLYDKRAKATKIDPKAYPPLKKNTNGIPAGDSDSDDDARALARAHAPLPAQAAADIKDTVQAVMDETVGWDLIGRLNWVSTSERKISKADVEKVLNSLKRDQLLIPMSYWLEYHAKRLPDQTLKKDEAYQLVALGKDMFNGLLREKDLYEYAMHGLQEIDLYQLVKNAADK